MRGLGFPANPLGLAKVYSDLLDGMVLDEHDEKYARKLQRLGLEARTLPILMSTAARSRAVGAATLELADSIGRRPPKRRT